MTTKMLKLIVFVLVIGLTTSSAQAATSITWNGGGGDALWTTGNNWIGGAAPLPIERAIIGNPSVTQPLVEAGMDISVDRIAVGESDGTGTCTLSVTGGSLTTTVSPIIVGHNPPATGTLTKGILDISGEDTVVTTDNGFLLAMDYNTAGTMNVSAGTVTAHSDGIGWNQQFTIGRRGIGTLNMSGGTITADNDMLLCQVSAATGIVNMTNGTINITGDILMSTYNGTNGTSEFNLDGGLVTAADLFMGTNARLDITDGVMILDGDDTETVQGYIDDDLITGYDDSDNVRYDLTSNPGDTTIYAIPEPATMVLLGLGGLLSLRRRRQAYH